ncbi:MULTISPECIES: hypothetical protein [unclassified Streptomyces]|uniref:hypothetical protein n=1 Tax=unclassified Streptomyces TaxID=2593676 RepID=UPI00159F283F|nr:hypothetical protein [Streptomyces sp. MnatMP-M77]
MTNWIGSSQELATVEYASPPVSDPVFARPDTGLSYRQQMEILEKAYAQTRPDDVTVTSWLVVVAQRGGAPE